MLPSAFECIACGLKISGLSKLSACGLGDAFTSTTRMTPAEYFGLYTEQDLEQARQKASSRSGRKISMKCRCEASPFRFQQPAMSS